MKHAPARTEWLDCQYCQSAQPRLYRLPLIRPMGELTGLSVCVFCYIRLVGVKPRPGALVAASNA